MVLRPATLLILRLALFLVLGAAVRARRVGGVPGRGEGGRGGGVVGGGGGGGDRVLGMGHPHHPAHQHHNLKRSLSSQLINVLSLPLVLSACLLCCSGGGKGLAGRYKALELLWAFAGPQRLPCLLPCPIAIAAPCLILLHLLHFVAIFYYLPPASNAVAGLSMASPQWLDNSASHTVHELRLQS